MSSAIPANSATSVLGSYDPETIRLAAIGSLVSSTVRFRVIVAAIKHYVAHTGYSSFGLIEWIVQDLRALRFPTIARGSIEFPALVDLHITYALNREPTEAELDEGRCVFAMSGARGIDAWAAEREARSRVEVIEDDRA